MSAGVDIRALDLTDAPQVMALYQATAVGDHGLAREADEINATYVIAFLSKAAISLGAFKGGRLAGEIHAGRLGPRQFSHVLTDLTVAVHPDFQGQGVGAALFEALFFRASQLRVERIELFARSGNAGAVRLYERLGFVQEGRFVGRVRLPDGTVEDDLAFAKPLGFKA